MTDTIRVPATARNLKTITLSATIGNHAYIRPKRFVPQQTKLSIEAMEKEKNDLLIIQMKKKSKLLMSKELGNLMQFKKSITVDKADLAPVPE